MQTPPVGEWDAEPPRSKWPWVLSAVFIVGVCSVLAMQLFDERWLLGSESDLLASAGQRLGRDDVEGALIEVRNALKVNPESAPARLLFGRALLDQGDAAGAQRELQRAQGLGLAEPAVAPYQAAALRALGQPEAVLTQYRERVLGVDKATPELVVEVAQAALSTGQVPLARQILKAALVQTPAHVGMQQLQARILAVLGDTPEAQRQVASVLERAPSDAAALLLRADLAAARQDVESAVRDYRQTISLRPRLADAHSGLVLLHLRQGQQQAAADAADTMRKALPQHSMAVYLQALTRHLLGDFAAAHERLQLLNMDGQPALLLLSGVTEARLGNLAQAESALSKVLQARPSDVRARRELADIYLRRAQPERALAMLEPLMAASAPDAAVWRLAGQAHVRLGDYARADKAFQQVRRIQPADKSVDLDVARLALARGDTEAGLRALEAVAKADPNSVAAELELVAAHMVRGDTAAALAAANALAAKQPQSAAPDLLRGRIQASAGQHVVARESFAAALKKEPGNVPAALQLAGLDLAEGKAGDAKKRFSDLIEREPRSTAALLGMADVARRLGDSRADVMQWLDRAVKVNALDVDGWRQAIRFDLDGADYAGALARARTALAAMPDHPDLLLLLGEAQLRERDLMQATSSFGRAAELRPGAPEPLMLLARSQHAVQRHAAGLASSERALALAPDWAPAARGAVRSALLAQRAARALDIARDWQKRRPTLALGWQLEGEITMTQQRWDAAVAAFDKAFAKAPSSDALWSLRAALLGTGREADAARRVDAWLRQHPDDVTLLNRLGEWAMARDQRDQAERHYRQALKAQPESPMLLNNLAVVLVQHKPAQALAMAESAASAAPYSPPILDTLAQAYAATAEPAKAVASQRRAVALAPKTLQYRLQLARYLLQDGNKQAAREELAQVRLLLGNAAQPPEMAKLQLQARD